MGLQGRLQGGYTECWGAVILSADLGKRVTLPLAKVLHQGESSRQKKVCARRQVPAKGNGLYLHWHFLWGQVTVTTCHKYCNCLLTGLPASKLWSVPNTAASVRQTCTLCHMTSPPAPKPPRPPSSLRGTAKVLRSPPSQGLCVLPSFYPNFQTTSPHSLALTPSLNQPRGLLTIPQTDQMCACLRAFARALPLSGTASSDTLSVCSLMSFSPSPKPPYLDSQ